MSVVSSMKAWSRPVIFRWVAAALLAFALVAPVAAAPLYWDGTGEPNDGVVQGGAGVWQAAGGGTNWADAVGMNNAAWQAYQTAVFGGAASGDVTVDNAMGQVAIGGMLFERTGYVVGGGSLQINSSDSVSVTVQAGVTAVVNSALTGGVKTSAFNKDGLGMLVLGGENTYASATYVNAGRLDVLAGGALRNTSKVTIASGAELNNNGYVNGDMDVSGVLSGSGVVGGTVSSAGGVISPGNDGAGLLTFTGGLVLTNGVLAMDLGKSTPNAAPVAGVDYDCVSTNGIVILGGTSVLALSFDSGKFMQAGDLYTLMDNSKNLMNKFGSVTLNGETMSVASDGTFAWGEYVFQLSYAGSAAGLSGGNNVALGVLSAPAIPEPTTLALLGAGVLGLIRRRRA